MELQPTRAAGSSYQQRGNVGLLLAVSAGILDAHDIERRRKRVGLFSGRRDDGGREHLVCRPARARIENMAVAFALMVEELRARAARAQRLIAQRKLRETDVGLEGVAEGDGPAGFRFEI